jgi:hypothetical protein
MVPGWNNQAVKPAKNTEFSLKKGEFRVFFPGRQVDWTFPWSRDKLTGDNTQFRCWCEGSAPTGVAGFTCWACEPAWMVMAARKISRIRPICEG